MSIHRGNDPLRRNFTEAYLIEGLWGRLKAVLKSQYYTMKGHLTFEQFVYEAWWRV
jgi:hypothetical protein